MSVQYTLYISTWCSCYLFSVYQTFTFFIIIHLRVFSQKKNAVWFAWEKQDKFFHIDKKTMRLLNWTKLKWGEMQARQEDNEIIELN